MYDSFPAVSRRELMAYGVALTTAAALPSESQAASDPLAKLWVRYITGGHPYRPSYPAMFLDPLFVEMEIGPSDLPNNFASGLTPGAGSAAAPVTGGPVSAGGPAAGAGGNGPPIFASDNPPDMPWEPSTTIHSGVPDAWRGAGL